MAAPNHRKEPVSFCGTLNHYLASQWSHLTRLHQVKGAGHTGNPGFSSTTGVQIAMSKFSEVTYNSATNTVIVGAGLNWDDVYAALEPYGVNVVGGRVTGVGVAGLVLGGGGSFNQCIANYKSTLLSSGYSWLSNEYGLAIDNVEAFELVMPSGEVVNATQTSYQDLFFALKVCQTTHHGHAQMLTSSQGGLNNFVCCTLILFPMR